MRTGIIIFGHGSSVESANQAVRVVAETAAAAGGLEDVDVAFLELGQPDLREAVARQVQKGITRVLVVPYFLTLGIHLQRDLPAIVEGIARQHEGIEIRVSPPLDGHPRLAEILVDRSREGIKSWQ